MTRAVDFSRGRNDQKDFDNLMALTGEGQVKQILYGSATIDVGSLSDGAGSTHQVTVTGAALGDIVIVGPPVDAVDMTITAYVQAANTIDIRVQNESGSATDLASGTWRVLVFDVT